MAGNKHKRVARRLRRKLATSQEEGRKLRKALDKAAQERDRLAGLLRGHRGLAEQVERALHTNAKLQRAIVKLTARRRADRVRIDKLKMELEAVAECNVMLRSELAANIGAADLRGTKAALALSHLEKSSGMVEPPRQQRQGEMEWAADGGNGRAFRRG